MEIWVLIALGGVGIIAGFVDAVAGGGGLVALPALLSVGMPPVMALATNKMQGATGTAVAAFTYWRAGKVKILDLVFAIITTFVGAYLGALTVAALDTTFLNRLVPVALIATALYFVFAPKLTDQDRTARLGFAFFGPPAGFIIGFYDGIFGPGTGSFFTIVFVLLFGVGVLRASANTKILNLTSNLAALALFIPAGAIVWPAAIAMGIGQMIGAYLGARTGLRFGAAIIRPLVVVVSIIMALRLLFSG